MDNIREKLVELIRDSTLDFPLACYIADHLLANGVTVQEWIPVSERLPEDREYVLFFDNIDMVHYGYLCAGDRWIDRCNEMYYYHVTHWMPLPQPPKGE